MRRWAWLERDGAAFLNNLEMLSRRGGQGVMAVLKANAYGHGALWAARLAAGAGAAAIAVATADEALSLRQAGIALPILVLGSVPKEAVPDLVRAKVALSVHQSGQVSDLAQTVSPGETLGVHLMVDTGMHRLGVAPDEAATVAAALHAEPGLRLEGLYTHLATADSDEGAANAQLRRFSLAVAKVVPRPPLVHALNSAGILRLRCEVANLVRPGIALYGLSPFGEGTPPEGLRPVLRLFARAVQVHRLAAGDGVGYGFSYVADRPVQVAVLPLGYADGYPRQVGGKAEVLWRGKRHPIVGRVSMDMLAVALPADHPVEVGDLFTLIGQDGSEQIFADQLAALAGTIGYDLVCGLGQRLEFSD